MVPFCQQHDIKLLAYGTLGGGLLSERFIGSEPGVRALTTVSLRKYKNMVDAWGGWSLFQELLAALKLIADKHHVSIANVAVRYVLEQHTVAGAIVGARLGVSEHIEDNAQVFSFSLDRDDFAKLDPVLKQSQDLLRTIGDCGDEYRR